MPAMTPGQLEEKKARDMKDQVDGVVDRLMSHIEQHGDKWLLLYDYEASGPVLEAAADIFREKHWEVKVKRVNFLSQLWSILGRPGDHNVRIRPAKR